MDQSTQKENATPVIEARGLEVGFGGPPVLQNLDIDVFSSEILGVVGASGTGKSVLLRALLGLNKRSAGTVRILDQDYDSANSKQQKAIDRSLGVLFQHGALFSALTVKQNVQVPMREYFDLSQSLMDELAMVKIRLSGLPTEAADKYPSELSGGMIKRAALARALALDPKILFLDEPTSGLDPIGAQDFDQLISDLKETLGLTVFMVTHDLDSLFSICDRIAVLGEKRVLIHGTVDDLVAFDHPWVQSYFAGERALRARGVSAG